MGVISTCVCQIFLANHISSFLKERHCRPQPDTESNTAISKTSNYKVILSKFWRAGKLHNLKIQTTNVKSVVTVCSNHKSRVSASVFKEGGGGPKLCYI